MKAQGSFTSWENAVRWLRAQPEQQALVRDAYYDDPLLDAAHRYWTSDEWHTVRGLLLRSAGLALDVGAGRGIASYALARDGWRVDALEPDGSALVGAAAIRALADAAGLPITVTQDFGERLPFPDQRFDLVFARAVLHHARDLGSACLEFARVLKPGGLLVAVREHVISTPEDLPAFLDAHPLHRLYGGENALLLDQYCAAIAAAGLTIERVLQPLESPINHAPYSVQALQDEVALRVGQRLPGAAPALRSLFRVPGAWPAARTLLQRFDHRPGRLYSFVARRPTS